MIKSNIFLISFIWLCVSSTAISFQPMKKLVNPFILPPQSQPRYTSSNDKQLNLRNNNTINVNVTTLITGAVKATVTTTNVVDNDVEILMMVLPLNHIPVCNPYILNKIGDIDLWELVSSTNITSDTWSLFRYPETHTNTYTATIASPVVRNQRYTTSSNDIHTAVAGGTTYSLLYTCLFKTVNDKKIKLLNEMTIPFICSDGHASGSMDLISNVINVERTKTDQINVLIENRITNYVEQTYTLSIQQLDLHISNLNIMSNKVSTINPFDDITCSAFKSTRISNLYSQVCTQRLIAYINNIRNISDILVTFNVIYPFRSIVPFTIHTIIPIYDNESQVNTVKSLAKSGVTAYVTVDDTSQVISSETSITTRGHHVINNEIKLIDSKHTCIQLFVESIPEARVKIISAHLRTCRINVCKNLTMVRGGIIDNAFARHVGGTLSIGVVTKLCYNPIYSISGDIFISWVVIDGSIKNDKVAIQRSVIKRESVPDDWCATMQCNGTYVIHSHIVCKLGYEYDPALGECISHGQLDIAGGLIIFIVIMFGLILIGCILMIAYNSYSW